MNGVQIRIRGKVQGVGFRPFVWQLARAQARCGDVCNDGDGVLVRLVGGDDHERQPIRSIGIERRDPQHRHRADPEHDGVDHHRNH